MKQLPYDTSKVRSILVPIDLPAAAAGAGFSKIGDVPQLRDCIGLISVEVFNTTLMTYGPIGTTQVNAPDALVKTAFLKIFNSGNEEVRAGIPAAALLRNTGNAPIEKLNIIGSKERPNPIDPGRSGFQFADLSLKGAGTVLLVNFVYIAP